MNLLTNSGLLYYKKRF